MSFGRLNALAKRLAVPLAELLDFEEPEAKEAVLKQLNAYLAGLPLNQLLFIQRALRQLARY